MSERFDAIVIGAGPAGEVAVERLNDRGLRVALAEKELVGGECAYWACIPSKTLLRPPEVRFEARRAAGLEEPEQRWAEVVKYRDYMIRNLDDSKQVSDYEKSGVTLLKGDARIAGPGRVEVAGRTHETDRIVVATGTGSAIPPIEGLEESGYWTNREATTLSEWPPDVAILGGGPVGIELGQMFQRYGSQTTVIEAGDRLLSREDPAVGELIAAGMREEGIDVRLGTKAIGVSAKGGRRTVRLEGGDEISAQELVVAVGRRPRVEGIGLETVGIQPKKSGVEVDERCRAAEGVWAIGDVTGIMPFTHVAKYQARVACADILGNDVRADYRAIPRVVFSDPEIAAVGLTEQQAMAKSISVATSRISLPEVISRPWTYEEHPRGELALLADRERMLLVGAWAVAPLAGEWIHHAALAIKAKIPIEVLRDTVAQFPTFSEAYLKAVERFEL